jgi:hypothetical protein
MILLLLASLTFTKSFPNSVPDYYRLALQESGDAEYFQAADDTKPVKFKVSEELVKQAFDLSEKLNHFKEPLETKRKIAFVGKKTMVWEDGKDRGEVTFNYSERPEASDLVTLFERISATQQASLELQRIMRFDKLGLMKYLLQTEIMLDHKDLADPVNLVPVLEQISIGKSFMDIARQRSRILLAKIQTPVK